MKKILPLLILTSASFAQAEDPIYWTSGGTYTAGGFNEYAKAVDGVSENPITFEGAAFSTLLTLEHDFEFVSQLNWEGTKAGSTIDMYMFVKNPATVTFNDVVCSGSRLVLSNGAGAAGNYGNAKFNKDVPYQVGFIKMNVTVNADCSKFANYVHFYNGSTITSDHNFALDRVYLRGSTYTETFNNKDVLVAGKLIVQNGATFSVDKIDIQANAKNEEHFFFCFGEGNTKETFKFTTEDSIYYLSNFVTKRNDTIIFKDFLFGDSVVTHENLTSDVFKDMVLVENDGIVSSFKTLVNEGKINVSTTANEGFYTYTMAIPEPSTYAMIFGALAIAFVIYRRKA